MENNRARPSVVRAPPFTVADWVVEPASLEIACAGRVVRLEPKVMALLVYLAERRGQVVPREELEAQLWPGVVVGYDSLTGAVQKLRRAFADDPRDPRVIETISKSGYRLIADVGTPSREAEPLDRKLTAILYADVARYSALTGADEEGTHRILSSYLDLLSALVERHHGRVVHYAGDAILADFATATDALECAAAIQEQLGERNAMLPTARRVQFRIGINLGEVIVDREDLYGDGVNVAARLEALAKPGGICISQAVRAAVGNKLAFDYLDIGPQKVKNIEQPVAAFHVLTQGKVTPKRLRRIAVAGGVAATLLAATSIAWFLATREAGEGVAPPHEARPSIAVLPFHSLGSESDQDYFSDGITNDIITDLSKFSNLLVIASNSVFVYKGRAVNVRDVARELSVRYVLEGSVRRAGGDVRINAQLIEASTNHPVWADRFDFKLDDIFRVQDEITGTVVTSLNVVLSEEERQRAGIRHTSVVEAYDLFLRARTYLRGTRKAHREARVLLEKAIALDPGFAAAYAEISFTYFSSFIMPMSRDGRVIGAALQAARKAVELDDRLPLAHARLAWALFAARRHSEALAAGRRAVALGPSDAEAHAQLGNVLNWTGDAAQGRQYVERAMRLNPNYPYYYLFYLGHSHYLQRDRDRAIELMQRVVTRAPYFLPVRRHLAVLYAEVGRIEEAREQTAEVLRIFPGASIEDERARCFYRWTPELMTRFFAGLRRSGMPEGVAGEEPISM